MLVSQWNTAQSELDRILTDIAALNTLANDVAAKAAMSAYLLESIRAAYGLSGAVDEDHRQLARVEDEVNRTIVLIDRLLGELNDTVMRQTSYANNERRHLTTLSLGIKNGQMFGPPLANSGFSSNSAYYAAPAAQGPVSGSALGSLRQPLVVIRFDRPDVPYKQALYSAISQVLGSRPSAAFDIVAYTRQLGHARPSRCQEQPLEAQRRAGLPLTLGDGPAGRPHDAVGGDQHLDPDQRGPRLRPLIPRISDKDP